MADLSCKGFSSIEERQAWLYWKGFRTPKCRLVNVLQSEDFEKELPYQVHFLDTESGYDGWEGGSIVSRLNKSIELHRRKIELGKL